MNHTGIMACIMGGEVTWAIGVMAPETHADMDMPCIMDMWATFGTGVTAPEALVDVVDDAKTPERKSAPKSMLLASLGVLPLIHGDISGGGSNGSSNKSVGSRGVGHSRGS